MIFLLLITPYTKSSSTSTRMVLYSTPRFKVLYIIYPIKSLLHRITFTAYADLHWNIGFYLLAAEDSTAYGGDRNFENK